MVGDYAQRDVGFLTLAVLNADNIADVLHNILNCIDEEKVVNALHYARKTLESHSGVDVRVFKRSVVV